MARRPRIDAPGVPEHVVQRGVNRCACFYDDLDREFYLASLNEVAGQAVCSIHAYVLMTNHVHLLVTGHKPNSVSVMMQALGRRYVRRFNNRHSRTGTLWEGRFKSSLVDSERYLLTCYRYIEMNPVRARMVSDPEDYPWSSVHANAADGFDPMLEPHEVYLSLDGDETARKRKYRALLDEALTDNELKSIRNHTNQCKALGSKRFLADMTELTGRDVLFRSPGRPWDKVK